MQNESFLRHRVVDLLSMNYSCITDETSGLADVLSDSLVTLEQRLYVAHLL